jgi:predicted methyltransferase
MIQLKAPLTTLLLCLGLACASTARPPTVDSFKTLVDAPDRSADDRAMDPGRKPAAMLAFIGVRPGWRVADLATSDGYTGELLARAVAPGGVVFGQNDEWLVEKFVSESWKERLAKPANKNVVRVVRDFDDPLPPEALGLDAVVMNLFYHDTYWLEVDRKKMNAAVFTSLRPGGVYVIVDHSAKDGAGDSGVKELHRIEEKMVRAEVEAAGFKLVETSDFLRNPQDTRDWFTLEEGRRGTSDRFALKFVKP